MAPDTLKGGLVLGGSWRTAPEITHACIFRMLPDGRPDFTASGGTLWQTVYESAVLAAATTSSGAIVGVGWKAGRGPTVLFALNPDGTPPLDLGPMGIAVLDDRERVIARSLCMLGDQAVIPFVADEGFVVRSYLVQPVRRAEPSPAPTQLKPAGTGDRRRGSSRLSIGVIAAAMLAARG